MKFEKIKFGDLFEYENKSRIKAGDGFTEGKYPFYTSSSVLSKYIDEYSFDKRSLIFGTGGNASVHYCETPFAVSTDCLVVFAKNETICEPKFVFYFLFGNINLLEEGFKGAGLKHISKGFINDLQIPLPPLPVQKRIAEILDAADALKRKDQELLKKYDELAQSVFIDMFGDPVKNEKGWEMKTIGEVCHYVKDGPHVSPKYTSTGIPFISVNNIIKGKIDLSNSKYISYEDFEIYSKKGKPEKNDMLYTKGGTTGFAKRVDVDFDFVQWVHVALLKFNQKNLNSVFFEYMLNSSFCYHQSQLLTKGIANRDLVLGEIKKIIILFPSIETQREFEKRVILIEACKEELLKTESDSNNLFNTLIQKAFKGELVQ